MDEVETWEWLEALCERGKPARTTIADWRPYEVIEPLTDADLEEVIQLAAAMWERDHR